MEWLRHLRLETVRYMTLRAYRNGDWRKLPIHDSGEPLIRVPEEMCHPFYADATKLVSDRPLYVRQGVLDQLNRARTFLLERGFDLKLYDGWRSVTLQENLFWHYLKEFTVKRFDLEEHFKQAVTPEEIKAVFLGLEETTQETLKQANRTYVSWPSKDSHAPSPHAIGGSVDVWLYSADGLPVNLGVPFDWMEEDAGAFYHFHRKRKKFAGNDRSVCLHRELLLYAMVKAGFSCYGPEIWHFNSGNQMDALVRGGPAHYGYIEP